MGFLVIMKYRADTIVRNAVLPFIKPGPDTVNVRIDGVSMADRSRDSEIREPAPPANRTRGSWILQKTGDVVMPNSLSSASAAAGWLPRYLCRL